MVTLQEEGYAFGQAVNIAGGILVAEVKDGVDIGSKEKQEEFKTNIKALMKTILDTREEVRR